MKTRTVWAALALSLSACGTVRAPVPMPSRADPLPSGRARCLVVFLPGLGDEARTFTDERFVDLLRAAHLSADAVAANATLGYYRNGSVLARLEADVLAPARGKGYEKVWLVGTSMGGFGSLLYASQHPEQVDGVLALAPWLGDEPIVREIRDAGGLAAWTPPAPAALTAENVQAQLWRWLREVQAEGRPGPITWLGYGAKDRMAGPDGLLAAAMPPARVLSAPGGHDWKTWRHLWREALARSDLAAQCGP